MIIITRKVGRFAFKDDVELSQAKLIADTIQGAILVVDARETQLQKKLREAAFSGNLAEFTKAANHFMIQGQSAVLGAIPFACRVSSTWLKGEIG